MKTEVTLKRRQPILYEEGGIRLEGYYAEPCKVTPGKSWVYLNEDGRGSTCAFIRLVWDHRLVPR